MTEKIAPMVDSTIMHGNFTLTRFSSKAEFSHGKVFGPWISVGRFGLERRGALCLALQKVGSPGDSWGKASFILAKTTQSAGDLWGKAYNG